MRQGTWLEPLRPGKAAANFLALSNPHTPLERRGEEKTTGWWYTETLTWVEVEGVAWARRLAECWFNRYGRKHKPAWWVPAMACTTDAKYHVSHDPHSGMGMQVQNDGSTSVAGNTTLLGGGSP